MPRPVQKKIRELLDDYARESANLDDLNSKRDEATRPAREKYEAAVAKVDKRFSNKIEGAKRRKGELEKEIKAELKKGYNAKEDSYALTRVESDSAYVEIKTSEQREIDSQEWDKKVPASAKSSEYWETVKVLIGRAEKFRSDIVKKIARTKRSHRVTVSTKD